MRAAISAALVIMGSGVMLVSPASASTPTVRGKYLVDVLADCGSCHTPRGPLSIRRERYLAGGLRTEGTYGVAIASNITPDRETGIGTWTDQEIVGAIREGKGRGRTLGPPMPYELYRDLSDTDVSAMVAYLRIVPAVKNAVGRSEYTIRLPSAWGPPVGSVPDAPRQDPVRYGAYLAGPVARCVQCHTPPTPDGSLDRSRLFAGGVAFRGLWGTSYSANLTPDPETGIGRRTDRQVIGSIHGVNAKGRVLSPPMPWTEFRGRIAENDAKAIVAYLRSLPPINNKIPRPEPPPRQP